MRYVVFAYGAACYALFLATFHYALGFIGGFLVPKGIDDGVVGDTSTALLVNGALLMLFAVQHTIMARPAFKARWTKIIPEAAERSTFVLATVVCFTLLFVYWRPLPDIVWHVEAPVARAAIHACFGLGAGIALASTFAIGHFELFGLAQVWHALRGERPARAKLRMPWLYRQVRHPIMLGFVILVWSAPTMTLGHLVFALGVTGYILVGLQFEERDLRRAHPGYDAYSRDVPMLFPVLWHKGRTPDHGARASRGNGGHPV